MSRLWFVLRPEVLKTALLKAVEKGQLEQITGKGARGTFQVTHRNLAVYLNQSHERFPHSPLGLKLHSFVFRLEQMFIVY